MLQEILVFVFSFLVILKIYFKVTFLRKTSYLDKIPGPSTRPFVGNMPLSINGGIYRSDLLMPMNVYLQILLNGTCKLYSKEGIFRIWMGFVPYVILYKAKTVEALLSSTKEIEKGREYSFMRSWLGTGLLTSSGKKWKARRKLLTPSFHFRILEEFQPVFDEQSRVLIKQIEKNLNKDFVDVVPVVTNCALDIIFETIMGVKLETQIKGDSPFTEALHMLCNIFVERLLSPWLWNDFVFSITSRGKSYNKSLNIVHSLTKKVIKSRKGEKILMRNTNNSSMDSWGTKKRLTFLDLLLEEHFRDATFTEEDIQEEVDTFAFGGHDTISMSLSWCLFLLGHHFEVQEKIHEEVVQILGNDDDTVISTEHIKQMKYLESVIKESQRIYPSVSIIVRTLKDDLDIDGYIVPRGTNCLVNVDYLHQDETVFPEPDLFKPERFLTENSNGRNPYSFVPFSAGPRNCIGQRFAFNEEKTVIANLVRHYRWKSLDPRDKIVQSPNITTRPIPGHRIKFWKLLSKP